MTGRRLLSLCVLSLFLLGLFGSTCLAVEITETQLTELIANSQRLEAINNQQSKTLTELRQELSEVRLELLTVSDKSRQQANQLTVYVSELEQCKRDLAQSQTNLEKAQQSLTETQIDLEQQKLNSEKAKQDVLKAQDSLNETEKYWKQYETQTNRKIKGLQFENSLMKYGLLGALVYGFSRH